MSSKQKTVLIVILSGGLVRDNGVWRSTYFDEGDAFGPLGDRLRVLAAAEIYKDIAARGDQVSIFVVGGAGRSKDPDHPTISSVYKKELIELGISGSVIIIEEKSETTFQQLQAVSVHSSLFDSLDIMLISNRYHLPRIEAIIRYAKHLSMLLDKIKIKQLILISAEDVLLKNNPERWKNIIEEVYQSSFMKKRIAFETRGVAQIKSNTYVFK